MKHKQEYVYQYPHSKEHLLDKLNDRRGINHNYCFGDYLIDIKNDDFFFLGVQRGGHSGGYWYVARIEENEYGTTSIRGRIVYNPDNNGNPQKETIMEKIEFILLNVILLPIILVIKSIQFIRILLLKIQNKPVPCPGEEMKLDKFMIDYLCCKKL